MKVIMTNIRLKDLSTEVDNYQIVCFDSKIYDQIQHLKLPVKPGIENSVPVKPGDAFISEDKCMALNFDFTKVSEEAIQIFITKFHSFLENNYIITQRI
jgi:hypothetical protein